MDEEDELDIQVDGEAGHDGRPSLECQTAIQEDADGREEADEHLQIHRKEVHELQAVAADVPIFHDLPDSN